MRDTGALTRGRMIREIRCFGEAELQVQKTERVDYIGITQAFSISFSPWGAYIATPEFFGRSQVCSIMKRTECTLIIL